MFNDIFLRYIKSNCCVHLEIGALLSWTHLVSLFSILSTTTKAQKKARGPGRSTRPCVYDLFDFAPLPPAPRDVVPLLGASSAWLNRVSIPQAIRDKRRNGHKTWKSGRSSKTSSRSSMLLPFLHDNQGWQDRLVQIQTRSRGGGATAGKGDRSEDEKKSEDGVHRSGGTKL